MGFVAVVVLEEDENSPGEVVEVVMMVLMVCFVALGLLVGTRVSLQNINKWGVKNNNRFVNCRYLFEKRREISSLRLKL